MIDDDLLHHSKRTNEHIVFRLLKSSCYANVTSLRSLFVCLRKCISSLEKGRLFHTNSQAVFS